MLRAILVVLLVPTAATGLWLAGAQRAARADFVVASDELRTIDPQRASYNDELQVVAALFEGLTRLNARSQLPEPALAESWECTPDGLVYTFRLRKEARWSDGSPIRAEDVRWSWLCVLDPRLEAQYASLLFVVEGAERYYRSRLNDDSTDDAPADAVGIHVADDRTLIVRLARPCSYWLDLTSFPTLAVVHPASVGRFTFDGQRVTRSTRHQWTRPEHLVASGPFVLESWQFRNHLRLRANPNYWDRQSISLQSIEVAIIGDPGAALLAYETGRIDLVRGIAPDTARQLKRATEAGERTDFHHGPRFATFFLRVNCRRGPLDDPAIRRVLALTIDKRALCERVLGLGETPADTYVPPVGVPLMPRIAPDGQVALYQSARGLGADLTYAQRVQTARALLDADPALEQRLRARPLELAYASEPPQLRQICEALQAMWSDALDLEIALRVMDRKSLSTRIRELDYDLVRSDWYGDYLDPSTFLDMFTADSGQNRTGWASGEYDRLIAAAAAENDARTRFQILAQAERLLTEVELPIIPLYFKTGNYLLRPEFGGVSDNVRDALPIHRLRREGAP